MNEQMMQIALIHAPLFSRAKIKQPSNLQSYKRNIAHLCLVRQHLMIIYECRIIDIYHRWRISNNLRLLRHDFLLVMFVDASKI
jgi:hypothetical protein